MADIWLILSQLGVLEGQMEVLQGHLELVQGFIKLGHFSDGQRSPLRRYMSMYEVL